MNKFLRQVFLIDDTPHKIAAGAALGVFLGIAPGTGVTATVLLASIFRFNRLAAIAGVLATNMWTLIFALPLAAAVGGYLFGGNGTLLIAQFHKIQTVGYRFLFSKDVFLDIVLPISVGFVVVSGIIALGFYVLILFLMKMHQKTLPC